MYFRTGNPNGLAESGSGELGIIVCGRVSWLYRTGRVGLCFLSFCVQELLEAQPAVVLVLKRLRRRGKWLEGLKSGELGIDDTSKRFRFSMHILMIIYF